MNVLVHPPRPLSGHSLRQLATVLAAWFACATGIALTGALDGSLIGTLAAAVVLFDAALFTSGRLR